MNVNACAAPPHRVSCGHAGGPEGAEYHESRQVREGFSDPAYDILTVRTSVVTFDTRLRERFYIAAEHAVRHAPPGRVCEVDALIALVECGQLCMRDGLARLNVFRAEVAA